MRLTLPTPIVSVSLLSGDLPSCTKCPTYDEPGTAGTTAQAISLCGLRRHRAAAQLSPPSARSRPPRPERCAASTCRHVGCLCCRGLPRTGLS